MKVCATVKDCPYGNDEEVCQQVSRPGLLHCYKASQCIPPWEVCDFGVQCLGCNEDELYC